MRDEAKQVVDGNKEGRRRHAKTEKERHENE